MSVADRLHACGVVPVVTIDRADDAPALAEALAVGGLSCVEITVRTAAALEAIRRVRSSHPDLLVGAGTILSREQAEAAIDAGARFIVTPGFAADVVAASLDRGVPAFPGVLTPTEIMRALDAGLTDLKLFPAASAGGIAHLRALAGPFPMVRFIPTGGIGTSNLAAYLAEPSVLAVGGSWMVRPQVLDAGDWDAVRAAASEAGGIVRSIRGAGARPVADAADTV